MATLPHHSTQKQYVDDGSVVARGRTLSELKENIAEDFNNIKTFLRRHKMVINADKTQLMLIQTNNQNTLQVELEGSTIINQPNIKILGLELAQDLKFEDYIWKGKKSLIRRVNYQTSKVATLKSYLPSKILHNVGNALINSTIQYGAAIWGATTQTNITKVQAAQVRSARILTGRGRRGSKLSHRQELLDSVNWPNVNQIIQNTTLNLTKNAITGNSSSGFNSLFSIKIPHDKLRNKGIRINHGGPNNRTNLNFSANATLAFNKLPAELR